MLLFETIDLLVLYQFTLYHRQQIQSISLCHRRHRPHYYHYYITIIIIVVILMILSYPCYITLERIEYFRPEIYLVI